MGTFGIADLAALGPLPLQDFDAESQPHNKNVRNMLYAFRWIGTTSGKKLRLGQPSAQNNWTYGQVHGGFVMEAEKEVAPAAPAGATTVSLPASGSGSSSDEARDCALWSLGGVAAISAGAGDDPRAGRQGQLVRPIKEFRDDEWFPDPGLKKYIADAPGGTIWPRGWPGAVFAGTSIDKQSPLFVPGFAGIVDPHHGGPAVMGTLFYDLQGGELDRSRAARVQSHLRVVTPFEDAKVEAGERNALAIQLNFSNEDGAGLGFVADIGKGPYPKQTVAALSSFGASGPVDVGDVDDKHKWGENRDEESFNPAHLSTGSLFIRDAAEPGDRSAYDAPLEFRNEFYDQDMVTGPYLAPTWLRMDLLAKHATRGGVFQGLWRWQTPVSFYIATPPTVTTPPTRTRARKRVIHPPPKKPGKPGHPGGDGGHATDGGGTPEPDKPKHLPDGHRPRQPDKLRRPRVGIRGAIGTVLRGGRLGPGFGGSIDGPSEGTGSSLGAPPVPPDDGSFGPVLGGPRGVIHAGELDPDFVQPGTGSDVDNFGHPVTNPLSGTEGFLDPFGPRINRYGGQAGVVTAPPSSQPGFVDPFGPKIGRYHKKAGFDANVAYNATTMETAFPGFVMRPQRFGRDAEDLRNATAVQPAALQVADLTTPVACRLEAFGRETDGGWIYCRPPGTTRYRGGSTTGGGLAFLDADYGLETLARGTAYTTKAGCTPPVFAFYGTYLGFGVPDRKKGLRNGYKITHNSDGTKLTFSSVDANGALSGTAAFELDSGAGTASAFGSVLGSGSDPSYCAGTDGPCLLDGINTFAFATLSGSTYTLTRQPDATTFNVSAGITVKSSGFYIYANTSVLVDGTIHNDGTSASGATGGQGGGGGVSAPFQVGATGATGVVGAGANGSGGGTTRLGGASGSGGDGVNFGGTGAAASAGWLAQNGHITNRAAAFLGMSFGLTGLIRPQGASGGAAGGGDAGTKKGGGGGGGGGPLGIASPTITVSATGIIRTAGGNGGNGESGGGNTGGGGGGGGGWGVLVCETYSNSGTVSAPKGTGGTASGGANGSNGVDGTIYVVQRP